MDRYSQITKDFGELSIAHQLPTHGGKCRNLHGHNYRVLATFSGRVDDNTASMSLGMVIDFTEVKRIYNQYVDTLVDHGLILGTKALQWLRDSFDYQILPPGPHEDLSQIFGKVYVIPYPNTTAEFFAMWIMTQMQKGLKEMGHPDVRVVKVVVYETATGCAECNAEVSVDPANNSQGS